MSIKDTSTYALAKYVGNTNEHLSGLSVTCQKIGVASNKRREQFDKLFEKSKLEENQHFVFEKQTFKNDFQCKFSWRIIDVDIEQKVMEIFEEFFLVDFEDDDD